MTVEMDTDQVVAVFNRALPPDQVAALRHMMTDFWDAGAEIHQEGWTVLEGTEADARAQLDSELAQYSEVIVACELLVEALTAVYQHDGEDGYDMSDHGSPF